MIDDFWFTDCACPDCETARKARTVKIGDKSYPVTGDTWEDYRCELMVRLSRDTVLAVAKRGAVPPSAALACRSPVADQYQLGLAMGIRGTPAIFLADGTRIGGYVPRAELEKAPSFEMLSQVFVSYP